VFFLVLGGQEAGVRQALSALFGGMSSVVLALISIRGFKRANEFALSDPKKSMMILYIGAATRFAAVLVLLGIGLGLFKLGPLAVFVGFALAQASYLMGVRGSKQARNPD
jgi:ATP synthase protein I